MSSPRRLPLTLALDARQEDASEQDPTLAPPQAEIDLSIDNLNVMSSATEAALAVAASLHPSATDHQEMEMEESPAQHEMEQEVDEMMHMPLIDMGDVEQQQLQLQQQYHDNHEADDPPPLPHHVDAAVAEENAEQDQPEIVVAVDPCIDTALDMNVGPTDGEAVAAEIVGFKTEDVQEDAPVAMEVHIEQAVVVPAAEHIMQDEAVTEEQQSQHQPQENIATHTAEDAKDETATEEGAQSVVATIIESNIDSAKINESEKNKDDAGGQEEPAQDQTAPPQDQTAPPQDQTAPPQDQTAPPQDQAAPPEKKNDDMNVAQESGANAGETQNEESNPGDGMNNNTEEEQKAPEKNVEPAVPPKKRTGRPRKSDAEKAKATPKKKTGRPSRQSVETADSGANSEPKKKRGRPRKSDASSASLSVASSVKNLNINANSTPGDIARAWCEYRKAEFEYHDLDEQALEVEQAKTVLEETTKHVLPALLADQENEWNPMYQHLKEYHCTYGHAVVPRTNPKEALESIPHLDTLGEWVAQQRLEYRKSRDKPDKYAPYDFYKQKALDELGFVWDLTPPVEKFFQRVDELRVFRSWYGDCDVPPMSSKTEPGQRDGVAIDPLLSKWVTYVRQEYKRTKGGDRNRNGTAGSYLTQDRIKLLIELGFKLEEGSDAEWDQQLLNVKKFYDTYGHFCMNVMIGDYYAELQEWLEQRRIDSREKNLSKEQLDKLKDAGIKFYTNGPSSPLEQAEVTWCQYYEQLRAYWLLHETTDIRLTPEQKKKSSSSPRKRGRPKRGEAATDDRDWDAKKRELAEWCDKQREEYIKFHAEETTKLSPFKIDRLDVLDFSWKLGATKSTPRKRSVEPEEDDEEDDEEEEEEETSAADDDDIDDEKEEETKAPATGGTTKRGRGRPKRETPKSAVNVKEEDPDAIVSIAQRKRPRRSTEASSSPTDKTTPAIKRKRGRPKKDSSEKKESSGTKKASL
jgi:hypothetical protein